MKPSQPKSTMEVPDNSQSEQQNITSEAPSDQDSPSALHNGNKDSIENTDINPNEVPSDQDAGFSNEERILKEDILIVQSLIEQCMHSYISQGDVVQTLQNRDRIDPCFTNLVWMKLEEQNAEVFKDYYKRAILIKEINDDNSWLKKQYNKMDNSANPIVRMAPQRANKLPGPLTLTFGTPPDVAYNSEASARLQLPSDGHPRENLRHLAHIPRSFGFTSLISDSTNLEDFGPLGSYPGSPFLLSSPPAQSDTEAKDQVCRPET